MPPERGKRMNEFKNYHPVVNFAYFFAVIAFSMIFINPFCLIVSLAGGVAYSVMLNGAKALKFNFFYILPLMLVSALINPAFNHEGVTILRYFPNGNPLTLESVLYGIAAACMIAGVIAHFSCYNKIMTSDKFVYLFGKIIPSLSLVLSMTLRFVPKFKAHIKEVSGAQKCVGRDVTDGGILSRAKNGIKILSIMITWSLENAVETADSMKSRGYGLPGRTAYSNYEFDRRDGAAFFWIVFLSAYIIIGAALGKLKFRYFPSILSVTFTPYGATVAAAYVLLFFTPVIIEIREVLRWKKLQSKI